MFRLCSIIPREFLLSQSNLNFSGFQRSLKAQLNLAPALLFRDCAEINHFCTKLNSYEEFFHCNTFPDKLNNFVIFLLSSLLAQVEKQ